MSLNRYSLVAFASDSPTTLDELGVRLGISIDTSDGVLLGDSLSREEDRVGVYKDGLLLCAEDGLQFFHEPSSGLTERLLRAFRSAKGCAVYYFSIPDLYGYAYFEYGKALRVKHGELDEVWVDHGTLLHYEKPESPFAQTGEKLIGR